MTAPAIGALDVPGATLHYEIQGSGPPLLILQGGDGDAGGAEGIVGRLVARYTVITYDRRGLSRSPVVDPSVDPAVGGHSDDAARLLAALAPEGAFVFGASLGALIGLDLVARYPERVRLLVAHEPPATELLPEAERVEADRRREEVENIFRREGGGGGNATVRGDHRDGLR